MKREYNAPSLGSGSISLSTRKEPKTKGVWSTARDLNSLTQIGSLVCCRLHQRCISLPAPAGRVSKREKEKCCGLGFIRTVGRGNSDGSYSFRYYNNSTPKRDIRDMLHIQHSINTFFYRFLCIPATDLHCDLLECSSLAFHVPQSDDFLRQPIIDV